MDHQATEPKVWFAGSTGVLAQDLGPVVVSSTMGSAEPAAVANRMKSRLTKLLASKNPMDGRTAAQGGAVA
jgi:multiple sugar transport system substrate-binding protein